jgi:superfamily I DNA/RNA helicase
MSKKKAGGAASIETERGSAPRRGSRVIVCDGKEHVIGMAGKAKEGEGTVWITEEGTGVTRQYWLKDVYPLEEGGDSLGATDSATAPDPASVTERTTGGGSAAVTEGAGAPATAPGTDAESGGESSSETETLAAPATARVNDRAGGGRAPVVVPGRATDTGTDDEAPVFVRRRATEARPSIDSAPFSQGKGDSSTATDGVGAFGPAGRTGSANEIGGADGKGGRGDILGDTGSVAAPPSELRGQKVSPKLKEAFRAFDKAQRATATEGPPHVVVNALAGSGKTWTLIVGVLWMFRDEAPGVWADLCKTMGKEPQPSPQQQAIWDAMALGKESVKTIRFLAFSKAVVEEFEAKWGWAAEGLARAGIHFTFATNHSTGFEAVRAAYGNVAPTRFNVRNLIAEELGLTWKALATENPALISATEKLVSMVKANLVPIDENVEEGEAPYVEAMLQDLCEEYEIDMYDERKGVSVRDQVFALVPKIITRCRDPRKTRAIDFDDQVWLPVINALPVTRYDMVLLDEAQDATRAQQALVKRMGKRLVLVGDVNQALYSWAGADSDSIPRMTKELGDTKRGCVTLPLTVTRRCGKAIVEEAKKVVPEFEAHEDNPPGVVRQMRLTEQSHGILNFPSYHRAVEPGDMVLCRVNAPLVAECFNFLRMGRRASILGRNIGEGLISLIRKMKAATVTELIANVSAWGAEEVSREYTKKEPDEAKMIGIQDRVQCVILFTEGRYSIPEIIEYIQHVFSDVDEKNVIRLSSIHKSKGLESRRVFFLQPKGGQCPHPNAKSERQRESERCCLFVGLTRAIEELVIVTE